MNRLKPFIMMMVVNFAILIVLNISIMVLEALGVIPPEFRSSYGYLFTMSLALGFGGALISLFISKWMVKKTMHVEVINDPEHRRSKSEFERWYIAKVEELSRKVGIQTPEIGIFDAPANAFATGWSRDHALVAVSTGLIKSMNRDEIEAVLGHEIGHIANYDMVTSTLMTGVLNTFVIFFSRIIGGAIDRAMKGNGNGMGYFLGVMVAQVFLSFLANIILMWYSRHREYKADAYSANLVGKDQMIAALARLGNIHTAPLDKDIKSFGIVGFGGLFASHPRLEDRIEALKKRG